MAPAIVSVSGVDTGKQIFYGVRVSTDGRIPTDSMARSGVHGCRVQQAAHHNGMLVFIRGQKGYKPGWLGSASRLAFGK